MNERKILLLKNAIDLTLNSLTNQLNQLKDESQREGVTKVMTEYIELRKELPEHIGGRPEDRK